MLTTIAAESTIFLVVSIAISFLFSSAVFAVSATAKQRGPIATFEQIVKFVDYSRGALLQANGSIKEL